MSPASSAGKQEVKTGMKSSASAPSSLPSAKTSHKSSLFDDDEDNDLFAPTTESRYLVYKAFIVFRKTAKTCLLTDKLI